MRDEGITVLECSANQIDSKPVTRPDIVFEDFEKRHYDNWTVEGEAFGEGPQPNTLDAAWFGKISFISSLYLAALKAGEQMAIEMGDEPFAEKCRQIALRGEMSILETFNGEYYIQLEDPKHENEIGVGPGCYIDQVFGQTWAHWTNLGRLFDRDTQLSALRALWKYNFVPNCGHFREKFKQGRWYATAR